MSEINEVIKADFTEKAKELISDIDKDEELNQFYQQNEELVDLFGGLEIFESLLEMEDDEFSLVAPSISQLFDEVLNEDQTYSEIITLFNSNKWNISEIEREINTAYLLINELEGFSDTKKDFLIRMLTSISNVIKKAYNLRAIDIPCEIEDEKYMPSYAREGDAGMDIISPKEYTINPGETIIIPTGIKMAIPKGYAILIQPRSGMSVKTKLRVANTPGLIDSGYRDEIGVIVENIEPPFKDIEYDFDDKGEIHIKSILHGQSYTITEGQKFAQMRLVQAPIANLIKVNSVEEIGENRGGGFGHTDSDKNE